MQTSSRRRSAVVATWIATLTLAVGCASEPDEATSASRRPIVEQEIAPARTANGEFAIDLYRVLANERDDENIFVSPFSISSILAIASEGAVGETAAEMGKALRFPPHVANTASDAAARPWQTEMIHRGEAAILAQLVPPPTSQSTRQRIAQLRQDIDAEEASAQKAYRARNYDEGARLQRGARAIAKELNELLATVDPYDLRIANTLWAEKSYPFRPSFINTLKKFYTGKEFFMSVNFRDNHEAVRARINSHIQTQTAGRIKDLLPAGVLDRTTKLVITNAVYFKGEWHEPFETIRTKDRDFTLADGTVQMVATMSQYDCKSARYGAFNGDGSLFATPHKVPGRSNDSDPAFYPDVAGFTAIELPYKGRELVMVMLVPQSETGLKKLEELLTYARLEDWIAKLDGRQVQLHIPRFKLETSYELVEPLQALGMNRAFNDPTKFSNAGAQFGAMTTSNDPSDLPFIGKVVHKTFIEVNEKGTEAAAASGTTMVTTEKREVPATRPFTPIFRADKPFFFLIRDNATKSLVFVGRVMNPARR